MGARGEALPDINGLAHGTRVPRLCVLGGTWDLLSSVVLARYMHSLIGVEDMVLGSLRTASQTFNDVFRGRLSIHVIGACPQTRAPS